MLTIPMKVEISPVEIPMQVETSPIAIPMKVAAEYKIGGDDYEGDYEVTPSQETQVLNTQNKLMRNNVTINPIPSNYGLITWNGGVLTVS